MKHIFETATRYRTAGPAPSPERIISRTACLADLGGESVAVVRFYGSETGPETGIIRRVRFKTCTRYRLFVAGRHGFYSRHRFELPKDVEDGLLLAHFIEDLRSLRDRYGYSLRDVRTTWLLENPLPPTTSSPREVRSYLNSLEAVDIASKQELAPWRCRLTRLENGTARMAYGKSRRARCGR